MTLLKRGLAALLLIALAACATPGTEAGSAAARPALWQVSDEDTTIYLFGTIHALPAGTEWRTPALDQAIAASSELVTEIPLAEEAEAAAAFVRLGLGSGLPPVAERVPEEKRDALRAALQGSPVPAAFLDRMKTWAVGVTLAQLLFERAGIDPMLGVERNLDSAFAAAGKTRSGLETAEQQFGIFDSLPEADQRAFLVGVLESPSEVRAEFDRMVAAWRRGDTDAIARTFNEEETLSPALRTLLLTRRNANWADWLKARLDRPGTILVAVGAGHLAGPDSVQEMLRQRGVHVRRLQ